MNFPDFRASEVTFQLLNQVAGRSGRAEKSGSVIIQTFNPDHYAIKLTKYHDYINFYNHEMKIRKELSYSPYFYMTSIKIISKDYEKAKEEAEKANIERAEKTNEYKTYEIIGLFISTRGDIINQEIGSFSFGLYETYISQQYISEEFFKLYFKKTIFYTSFLKN